MNTNNEKDFEIIDKNQLTIENEEFSYKNFFEEEHPESLDYGAVGLITANQFITMKNIDDGKESHALTWANILLNISPKFRELFSKERVKSNCVFKVGRIPNIYIRILNEGSRLIYVDIPQKISKDHYEMFVNYYEKYKDEINQIEDVEYGISCPQGYFDVNSFEELISITQNQIDQNYKDYENEDIISNELSNKR